MLSSVHSLEHFLFSLNCYFPPLNIQHSSASAQGTQFWGAPSLKKTSFLSTLFILGRSWTSYTFQFAPLGPVGDLRSFFTLPLSSSPNSQRTCAYVRFDPWLLSAQQTYLHAQYQRHRQWGRVAAFMFHRGDFFFCSNVRAPSCSDVSVPWSAASPSVAAIKLTEENDRSLWSEVCTV